MTTKTCNSDCTQNDDSLRPFTLYKEYVGNRWGGMTGEWRRLHNEKLYAPYSSPNNIRVIKSRRLRWAGHVARMGERRGAYRVLGGET